MASETVTIVYEAQTRMIRAIINPSPRKLKVQRDELSVTVPLSFYKQHSSERELASRLPQTAPAFDPT